MSSRCGSADVLECQHRTRSRVCSAPYQHQ
jgi:hypothetical protein